MRRQIFAVLLAVFALVVSGCLDAKKYSDLVYDEKTDTFRMLRVYYHINGNEVAERDYLASLWMNRDHVLPVEIISIMGENARVVVDAKNYYSVSLGSAGEKPAAPSVSVVDLSKIVNKPGKFFIAGDNSLGYYHQIDIPGAQIDELLTWGNEELRKMLGQRVTAEMDRRAKGGAVGKWADIEKEIVTKLKQGAGGPPPAPKGAEGGDPAENKGEAPFNCLSMDTLKLIQKGIAEKKIAVVRKGAVFSMAMPATEEDRKGFMALRDIVKNELLKTIEAGGDEKSKVAMGALDAFTFASDDKSGEILTAVDYVKLRKSLEVMDRSADLKQPADPAKAQAMTKTLAALKDAGIEIDEKIKIEEIPGMFMKGTLPVDNPKKSVEAGTGLFK